MLNFGNKEFRNLQEQVFKNMKDIESIEEGATVLAQFGIKVIGQVDSVAELPDPATYDGEYGDAFIVGETAPFNYYIFTRAFEGQEVPQWYDLGIFPQPGPQGPQGPQGPVGPAPSITATGSVTGLEYGQTPTIAITRSGTDSNPVLAFAFELPGGPQGIQGPAGPQGIQGPVGPVGPQGVKGDPGFIYTLYGQISSASNLPDPTQVSRNAAYLVGASDPYDVYCIIGDQPEDYQWINLGPVATIDADTHLLSDTWVTSGTCEQETLIAINNQTNTDFCRVGTVFFQKASAGKYYTYDTATGKLYLLAINLVSGVWAITEASLGTNVASASYSVSNSALSGITINGTTYKLLPFVSILPQSWAGESIAIGTGANVNTYWQVAIGYNASATSSTATVIGSGARDTGGGVAIGRNTLNPIPGGVSFDGGDGGRTIHLQSTSNIFFRNEIPNVGKITTSQYTGGHYLYEYISLRELAGTTSGNVFTSTKKFNGSEINGIHLVLCLASRESFECSLSTKESMDTFTIVGGMTVTFDSANGNILVDTTSLTGTLSKVYYHLL